MKTDLGEAQKAAVKMAEVIGKFLMDNGGFDNGYKTWAKGYVAKNDTGTLKISVNNDDLSVRALTELAGRLEERLKKLIPKGIDPHFMFIVNREAGEWDGYATRVGFEWYEPVELN